MPESGGESPARHPFDVPVGDRRALYHARWPDAGPDWKAAIDAGHDMDLLLHCLSLTPEQRWEEHKRFVTMIERLERARDDARSEEPTP